MRIRVSASVMYQSIERVEYYEWGLKPLYPIIAFGGAHCIRCTHAFDMPK